MLTVRAARREDYPAYARLFPELEVPDPVPDIEAWWSRQGPTTVIAEDGARVVGYGSYDVIGSTLFVRNVVTSPEARRTGVGRALMQSVLERGRSAGASRWCLNVKDDNTAAIRMYESLGFRVAYPARVLRVPWTLLLEAAPAPVEVRAPEPSEDAEFEARLNLLPGLVARRRELSRVLLGALDDGHPVGLASFDAGFGGCYPFRARDLGVAAALSRVLDPHRQSFSPDDWRGSALQLVIEDQEPLADELERSGAQRLFRIIFLDAPLP